MNFADAEAYCNSLGYNLVSIHSADEFEDVQSLCRNQSPQRHCWIGLTQDGEGQPWHWVDGTPADYGVNPDGSATSNVAPWWPGVCALYITLSSFYWLIVMITFHQEPSGGNENCVHLFRAFEFTWNDVECLLFQYPFAFQYRLNLCKIRCPVQM